jgi:hypothetical protein
MEVPLCPATGPQGFICTLTDDHEGDHEAWGASNRTPVATWHEMEDDVYANEIEEMGDEAMGYQSMGSGPEPTPAVDVVEELLAQRDRLIKDREAYFEKADILIGRINADLSRARNMIADAFPIGDDE